MMINEYLYDGSFEGLLTAVFYCYPLKCDYTMTKQENYIPNLISTPINIKTEVDKFSRVYSSIRDKLSYQTLKNVYFLYLTDIDGIENLIISYLKLCYTYGDNINLAKNNDIISKVDKYYRRVSLEAHRFTGFVRFKKIIDDIYYSAIEPDHNILPIITSHFTNRFSNQNFIIHDLKRDLALIYNKETIEIIDFSKNDAQVLLNHKDDDFESLWKVFYNSVNIKERENQKLQKMHMPTRYWQHLTELK